MIEIAIAIIVGLITSAIYDYGKSRILKKKEKESNPPPPSE